MISMQLKELYEQLCLKGFPNQYDDLDSFPTVIGIPENNAADTVEKNVDSSKTIDENIYTSIYTKENKESNSDSTVLIYSYSDDFAKESKSYSFFIDDEIEQSA